MKRYTKENVTRLARFYADEAQSKIDVCRCLLDESGARFWIEVRGAAEASQRFVCRALACEDGETQRREVLHAIGELCDLWRGSLLGALDCPERREEYEEAALRYRYGMDLLMHYLDEME